MPAPAKLLVASSNSGKLREYQMLAAQHAVELALLPEFASLPSFEESAPTFAEIAAGKALHYSRLASLPVLAEDSGLVVPALGGAPGPRSARYGGPNATDADRVRKLLGALSAIPDADRQARFVCVVALARCAEVVAVVSASVEGRITEKPQGTGGFGYDPIFFFEPLARTFAELSTEEKNRFSHRGQAFRKLLDLLASCPKMWSEKSEET